MKDTRTMPKDLCPVLKDQMKNASEIVDRDKWWSLQSTSGEEDKQIGQEEEEDDDEDEDED